MWNKTKDAGGKTAAEDRDILLKEINDLLIIRESYNWLMK